MDHVYQDMLALWLAFFDRTYWDSAKLPNDMREPLLQTLYDGVMGAVMRLTENLDLTVRAGKPVAATATAAAAGAGEATGGAAAADSGAVSSAQLEAERPKDFAIFLNLVEFVQLLLPALPADQFERWVRAPLLETMGRRFAAAHVFARHRAWLWQVYPYGRHLIEGSAKHALVSGFYKLFALTLQLGEEADYFGDGKLVRRLQFSRWSTDNRADGGLALLGRVGCGAAGADGAAHARFSESAVQDVFAPGRRPHADVQGRPAGTRWFNRRRRGLKEVDGRAKKRERPWAGRASLQSHPPLTFVAVLRWTRLRAFGCCWQRRVA